MTAKRKLSYRENTEQKNLLNQFLAEHGVQLSEETLDKLYQFADLVVDTKEFGNLISAKDAGKFLSRHIADSLVPYIYIRRKNGPTVLQTKDERGECCGNACISIAEPKSLGSKSKDERGECCGNACISIAEPKSLGSKSKDERGKAATIESMSPIENSVSSRMTDSENATSNNLSSIVYRLSSKRWADMGAGAGCPVFPLAIAMPEIQFYAVEPRHMRVNFMQMVKEKLHLDNLTVVSKRFETSGLTDLDFISCRALSTFENDWERALPGLKKGGTFVTLKSFNNIAHLENNPKVHIQKYELPEEEQVYALVTRGNNE